ncbi:MAG: PAS domain-containing protein, partial [Angelakisella sp.]
MSSLKGLVDKRTDYMLVDAVQQYGTTFSDSIECKLSAVSTVADILSNMKADDMEQIYSTLAKIAFKEHFHTVALSNTSGQTITNRRDMLDIANQEYFIRAKDGESVISDAMKSPIDETPVLILSVPIYNHKGVSGVLSCGYELSQLEQTTAKPRYFGEAYGMIFSEKGEVISWEQHKNSLGVNQSVDQIFGNCKMFGGMTAEMLHHNMENRMSGSFSIEFMGSKRLVCYMPLEINNWYAFCFAPFTIYNRETADVGRIVTLLVIEMVLGLGMLFCYILYSNYRHSKLLGAANIKYEAILSNICGGVEVTTFAKAIEEVELIYASAGFTEITGYTLEDFRLKWGGKLYHHVYEKDREAVSRMLRKVSSDNPEYNVEYRIVHKDGHIVWVMDRGKLIENEEDAFQCHSVLTDISEIKRQQEKLAISEERFRIAIESADNMMFDYDSINCVYVDFANSVHMMGKTKEQINADLEYTHVLTERERTAEISKYFYHPDDLATVMQQSSIGLESGDVYFDARVHCANDRYVWCRIHLTIINNVDGIPYRVLGFMGNIDVVKRQA